MTITPLSNVRTNLFDIRIRISSSLAPTVRMILFGFPINPSSSALIFKWKYKHCVVAGISKNASLSTIFIVNIRFCANSKIPFSNSWFFKSVYFNSTSIPLIFSSPFTGITRDGTPFISFNSIRAILSGWMQIVASGVTIFAVFEL